MTTCPFCEFWDAHEPGCIVGQLQDLGRNAHRRAQLLTVLFAHGEAMTLAALSDATGRCLTDVADVAVGLFAEGLAYPASFGGLGQQPSVALTTAPHVREACLAAAQMLGMILAEPRILPSPVLLQRGQP